VNNSGSGGGNSAVASSVARACAHLAMDKNRYSSLDCTLDESLFLPLGLVDLDMGTCKPDSCSYSHYVQSTNNKLYVCLLILTHSFLSFLKVIIFQSL
jgi:hypothetical protein